MTYLTVKGYNDGINKKLLIMPSASPLHLDYINNNVGTIINRAKRTYLRVINNYNPNLTKNSCHFKLLEQKCLEYEAYLKSIKEVAVTKETDNEDKEDLE